MPSPSKANAPWVTRGQLLETVWGYDAEVDDRAVDTCVTRLRRKLQVAYGRVGRRPEVAIEAVWGIGYKFVTAADADEAAPRNEA